MHWVIEDAPDTAATSLLLGSSVSLDSAEQLIQLLCATTRTTCSAGAVAGWGCASRPAGGDIHTASVPAQYGVSWVHLDSTAKATTPHQTRCACSWPVTITGRQQGCLLDGPHGA